MNEDVLELFKKKIFGFLQRWPLNNARAVIMAKAMEETAEALRNLPDIDSNKNVDICYEDFYKLSKKEGDS